MNGRGILPVFSVVQRVSGGGVMSSVDRGIDIDLDPGENAASASLSGRPQSEAFAEKKT